MSGVAAWQWRVAAREKARAEQRFRDVRQLANALIFKIHDAVLPLPGSTAVRRTIVDEAIGYLERLEAESGGDAALRLELAKAYLQIGGILGNIGAANLGDRDGAIRQFERARQMIQPLAASADNREAVGELVEADLRLSTLRGESGERDKAVSLAREAVQLAAQQMERAPNDDSAGDLAARAYFGLAIVSSAEEAPAIWRRTLEVLRTRPDSPAGRPQRPAQRRSEREVSGQPAGDRARLGRRECSVRTGTRARRQAPRRVARRRARAIRRGYFVLELRRRRRAAG